MNNAEKRDINIATTSNAHEQYTNTSAQQNDASDEQMNVSFTLNKSELIELSDEGEDENSDRDDSSENESENEQTNERNTRLSKRLTQTMFDNGKSNEHKNEHTHAKKETNTNKRTSKVPPVDIWTDNRSETQTTIKNALPPNSCLFQRINNSKFRVLPADAQTRLKVIELAKESNFKYNTYTPNAEKMINVLIKG